MSWHIRAFPDTAGGFICNASSAYDLRDELSLEVHVLTPDEFGSEQEASMYMAQHISSKLPWLDASEFGPWTVDIDALRTSVEGGDGLPPWLAGRRQDRPNISRSFAFDLEQSSTPTDSPAALPATNIETARAAGRKVMLSHVAAFHFFKEDPFASLELTAPSAGQMPIVPPELSESLAKFRVEHGGRPTAFLMMKFGRTPAHSRIVDSVAQALLNSGIAALRADEREYHAELYFNILTYMHGCAFGVAIFERLEGDEFNPNVSLEVGYMLGLGKRVCLLKDRTLKGLHADLVGKLYREFDPQNPERSIPDQLDLWLRDWKDTIGI